jgi:deazaflavin-dependent oxidoreductase (nitroreductase family)
VIYTMADWNSNIIEEFRASHGKVGGMFEGAPMLLLTHTGAKTGTRRTNPLAYQRHDGRVFVFATKGGSTRNPHWFLNLKANTDVTVEIGVETFEATAVEITGAERDEIYARQSALRPAFGEYQKDNPRTIPVVEIIRKG